MAISAGLLRKEDVAPTPSSSTTTFTTPSPRRSTASATATTTGHAMYDVDPSSSTAPMRSKHAILHPDDDEPSFTFVCLGVGGGPLETDCSCYLLKPAHRAWTEGSVVVEGGSWLGALTTVLHDTGPDSAFAGVEFPFDDPALRAGFIGSFAHSFLVSHAHLDHILGLVLGSASLPGKRNVYGLKGTLDNLLDVFNGKIWPRLASYDEDGGPAVYRLKALEPFARLPIDKDMSVTPFALSHGLNPSVIPAPPTPTPVYASRLSLSSKRLSLPVNGYFSTPVTPAYGPERFGLASSGERPVFTSPFAPEAAIAEKVASIHLQESPTDPQTPPGTFVSGRHTTALVEPTSPTSATPQQNSKASINLIRGSNLSHTGSLKLQSATRSSRRPRTALGSEKAALGSALPHTAAQRVDLNSRASSIATDANLGGRRSMAPKHMNIETSFPALDSTAFFITNEQTGKDVLFFGDVEPDTISQSPRNERIWSHAGQRFAAAKLNTVFLECSFPASHPTEFLYGHLSVSHVFDELRVLARSVVAERKRSSARQRTASNSGKGSPSSEGAFRRLIASQLQPIPALLTSERTITEEELLGSLQGLHVVIIHVKTALFPSYEATPRPSNSSASSYATAESDERVNVEPLRPAGRDEELSPKEAAAATARAMPYIGRKVDPRTMQVRILQELQEVEENTGLGVHFVMAAQGMKIEC